jgi:hypothetical protein
VTDTNNWIDLQVRNLLDNVFEWDARWLIPDLAGRKLDTDDAEVLDLLVGWGLNVQSLSGDEVEAVIDLNAQYAAPSRTDVATLVVARAEGGVLVTGDQGLRDAAEAEGIEVHGTLWVADALVDTATVEPPEAARALELMKEAERRLPEEEVNWRVDAWGQ